MNKTFTTEHSLEYVCEDGETFVVNPGKGIANSPAYKLHYPCGSAYSFLTEAHFIGFAKFLKNFASKVGEDRKENKYGAIVSYIRKAIYMHQVPSAPRLNLRVRLDGAEDGNVILYLDDDSKTISSEELKDFAETLLELVKKNGGSIK